MTCERLSDRMPEVARGAGAWDESDRRHLAGCPDCQAEWRLVTLSLGLGQSVARAVDPDSHTFKSAADLQAIYCEEQGLSRGEDTIAYCRIGERSSHTWFVLTYLLGYPNVRNYDGSWTEWGNSVGVPVEK